MTRVRSNAAHVLFLSTNENERMRERGREGEEKPVQSNLDNRCVEILGSGDVKNKCIVFKNFPECLP